MSIEGYFHYPYFLEDLITDFQMVEASCFSQLVVSSFSLAVVVLVDISSFLLLSFSYDLVHSAYIDHQTDHGSYLPYRQHRYIPEELRGVYMK
jgi:hypothetical protein